MDHREYWYFKNMTPDEYFVEYGRGSPSDLEVFVARIKYDIFNLHKIFKGMR